MRIKLFFIRKIKALFMLFRLHLLVEPFSGALLNLVYLSKMSAWRAKHGELALNDFYSAHYRYDNRQRLHRHLMATEELGGEITYLEFGVARGESFRWWVEFNRDERSTFHGFDTFTGLPEDWNVFKKGDMSAEGQVPDIADRRITWHAGLFQDTLPPFLAHIPKTGCRVVHLDGDLYSSAYYAMNMLAPYLQAGDILIFDEFGVPTHEFKAFTEFFASHYRGYEVLGAVNNYLHLAVRLT